MQFLVAIVSFRIVRNLLLTFLTKIDILIIVGLSSSVVRVRRIWAGQKGLWLGTSGGGGTGGQTAEQAEKVASAPRGHLTEKGGKRLYLLAAV